MTAATVDVAAERGTLATLAHGMRLAPEFRAGLATTLTLAVVATGGRVVVPIAVQQTIDHGLKGPGGPDLALVRLAWAGVRPVMLPAPVRYPAPAQGGVSHFRYARDNLLLARLHLRLLRARPSWRGRRG